MRRAFVGLAIASAALIVFFVVRGGVSPASPATPPEIDRHVEPARELLAQLHSALRDLLTELQAMDRPDKREDGVWQTMVRVLELREHLDAMEATCGVSPRELAAFWAMRVDAEAVLAHGRQLNGLPGRFAIDTLLLELVGRPDAAWSILARVRPDTGCGNCDAPRTLEIHGLKSGLLLRQGRVLEALAELEAAVRSAARFGEAQSLPPDSAVRVDYLRRLAGRSTWPTEGDQRLVDLYPGTTDEAAARTRLLASGMLRAPTIERLRAYLDSIDAADAIRAIGHHRLGGSFAVLAELGRTPGHLEGAIIDALGDLGDPHALELLRARIPADRRAPDLPTMRALFRLGDQSCLLPFLRDFAHADWIDAWPLEEILGSIKLNRPPPGLPLAADWQQWADDWVKYLEENAAGGK